MVAQKVGYWADEMDCPKVANWVDSMVGPKAD